MFDKIIHLSANGTLSSNKELNIFGIKVYWDLSIQMERELNFGFFLSLSRGKKTIFRIDIDPYANHVGSFESFPPTVKEITAKAFVPPITERERDKCYWLSIGDKHLGI